MKLVCVFLLITLSLQAQDWTPLYNGENLEGFEHVGEGHFIVEDGILKSQGGMGLLWFTAQKFSNVKLRVVYKGADKNNAGVFIRIPEKPTEAWMPVNKAYEVQIDDREDEWHKTGVLYSLTKAKASPGIPGDWNTMEISLMGDRTVVHVNGVLVTDFTEGDQVPVKTLSYEPDRGPRPEMGYVGLQNHGEDDVIEFREFSYQEIED
jgi:hypothetical protein